MTIAKNLVTAAPSHVRAGTPPKTIRGPFPISLAQAINTAGYTVNAAAKWAGIQNTTLSDLLSGKTVSRPSTREKIAEALGLGVAQILWPEKAAQ